MVHTAGGTMVSASGAADDTITDLGTLVIVGEPDDAEEMDTMKSECVCVWGGGGGGCTCTCMCVDGIISGRFQGVHAHVCMYVCTCVCTCHCVFCVYVCL